ncbi:hypothetical protein AMJ87_02115 [candidate division WOR_3 bacterium SM23_60]|uniref:Type II secretion system protein GspE N-terminal domain-containing protein n=1 Tax=candidate division WOR_3 bacterium SM23_60 TaxID=1703780 RepID=A0A0S8GM17_UNCW3|nr:MAG: hypothetical protein AMJ87_02115 [candidate division WOR_3 bacterium SM23_60]
MTARIGELLVRGGCATECHISEALKIQKKKKKKIGEILVELGYVNADDLDRMLSEQAALRDGLKFRHWPYIP